MAFEHDLYYHRVYSLPQVKKINQAINKYLEPANDQVKKGPSGSIKNCAVSTLTWGKVKPFLKDFIDRAYFLNQQWYGAHVYPWTPYHALIHNHYKTGHQYSWHTDESACRPSSSKLTCLLNLSEKSYKGGNFQICRNTPETIEEFNTPGVMVVFPSYILHRIMPLTQGTRTSVAALLEGPQWV